MKTLEEILATIPEGYGFCVRDDKECGFMANITTPDFENSPGAVERRQSFPRYGRDLCETLERSIADAKAAML